MHIGMIRMESETIAPLSSLYQPIFTEGKILNSWRIARKRGRISAPSPPSIWRGI